jgi:hypothetical protein
VQGRSLVKWYQVAAIIVGFFIVFLTLYFTLNGAF